MSPGIDPNSVAVIGAGMAGIGCARTLVDAGRTVRLFDKGRAPGGRVATRRVEDVGPFDHGAAFFTVRDEGFARAIAPLREAGWVLPWQARIAPNQDPVASRSSEKERLVGVPGMSSLPRSLARGLAIATETRIVRVTHVNDGWRLADERGKTYGPFAAVVVALPSDQAAALLTGPAPTLAAQVAQAEYAPCWTVLAAWPKPLGLPYDVYEDAQAPVSWAALDSSRPGRPEGERWVLQAAGGWSLEHLEASPPAVIAAILAAFAELSGVTLPVPTFVKAHRWRYARVTRPLNVGCLVGPHHLIACGDFCLGPRIESAWLSGVAAAQSLL